eukprot:SAG31_NODE_9332_length_1295_cov_1.586957_2_plen_136_part_01
MQSITKTTMHLLIGRLVARGKLKLDSTIGGHAFLWFFMCLFILSRTHCGCISNGLLLLRADSIMPGKLGSGYKYATVQQVLDMSVSNNFYEGYESVPGQESYNRQEIGMGWRLPSQREERFGMRDYISGIEAGNQS